MAMPYDELPPAGENALGNLRVRLPTERCRERPWRRAVRRQSRGTGERLECRVNIEPLADTMGFKLEIDIAQLAPH